MVIMRIVYLDIRQFISWKNDNWLMYVNFTDASKEENLYAFVIGFEDEGAIDLRFWRGNSNTLWNCSVVLSYEDYTNGLNCVKVTNWNSTRTLATSDSNMDLEVDSANDGLTDYFETIYGLNSHIK